MADPFNLQILNTNLQNVVTALATMTRTIRDSTAAIFPQTQATSTSATAGSVASPGNFAGFIDVTLPDGSTAKVPYFKP